MKSITTAELPIVAFKTQKDWEQWLDTHYNAAGIWMRFYKKNSNVESISYSEAVETALCYGWIDSQAKKYDEKSYLQKFTPRRSKSIWSKINTQHIERLMKEGRMKPSGLKQVEEAKADGRWEAAYDPPSATQLPEDFLKELKANKKAMAFYEGLNKTNTYAISWRLQTAKKAETRKKRIAQIIAMLEEGKTFH